LPNSPQTHFVLKAEELAEVTKKQKTKKVVFFSLKRQRQSPGAPGVRGDTQANTP